MLFLIRIAYGSLSVTIEQRAELPEPSARIIETTGVEVTSAEGRPGLAKTHGRPELRVVRSA